MADNTDQMDLLGSTTFSEFLIDKPDDGLNDPPPKNDDNPKGDSGSTPPGDSGDSGADDADAQAVQLEDRGMVLDDDNDDTKNNKDATDRDGDQGGDGDDQQIIDLIQENLGYEVEGTFENSVEGVTEYARKAIPKAAEQMVQQLFEEYPEAQQLINHLSQGNSLDTFMEGQKIPSHLTQELTEENVELQKQIMVDQFVNNGMAQEDAETFVANLEENGKLFSTAKNVHGKMKASYQEQIEAKKQAELEAQQEQQRQAQQRWEQIKETVNKGDLGGIRIPQSKQGAFWEYLSKPVNGKNQTSREIKQKDLTLEQQLMLEYIVFSDFKVGTSKKVQQDLNALRQSNNTRDNRLKGAQGKQDQPVNNSTSSLDGLTFSSFVKE